MARLVVFVASENGALSGGKVGGIADVIRDLSGALCLIGWKVIVLTPGYGNLVGQNNLILRETIESNFAGQKVIGEVSGRTTPQGVDHLVIDHPLITGDSPGQIYFDDGPSEPFATDANRFSLFSALVADWLLMHSEVEFVHLHDWHASMVLLLRAFDPKYKNLSDTQIVYTIHNLALQGIRPLTGHHSSLKGWFPDLQVDDRVLDPRWPDCVNLMRAGINLADRVNTVSPNYAAEIVLPDQPGIGFHGGAGLHDDLSKLAGGNRLRGILNGCEYPNETPGVSQSFPDLCQTIRQNIVQIAAKQAALASAHFIALNTLDSLKATPDKVIVTSVGRLTSQKMGMLEMQVDGKPVLDHLLNFLADDGVLILVGSGDPDIESRLRETATRFNNFVFVCGYAETLVDNLYQSGHLFLMPSTFEPCGISQMLAMRGGQPCLVHEVGGLKDTVFHNKNGWSFSGNTPEQQARSLMNLFATCTAMARKKTNDYKKVCYRAAQSRFTWQSAARQYADMYEAGEG